MLALLCRIFLAYCLAFGVSLRFFDALRNDIMNRALPILRQARFWPPTVPGGDYGPPPQIFYPLYLAALFLVAPWLAEEIRRRWFPATPWYTAQLYIGNSLVSGGCAHLFLFPALLTHYPFETPLRAGDIGRLVFTLHAQSVFFAALLPLPFLWLRARNSR